MKAQYIRRLSSAISHSDEVIRALRFRSPIVALESTIISHGMPYPRNIEVARTLEEVVRRRGAIPATIGFLNGVPKVGMSNVDLNVLANAKSNRVLKAARRDIADICSKGYNAGMK